MEDPVMEVGGDVITVEEFVLMLLPNPELPLLLLSTETVVEVFISLDDIPLPPFCLFCLFCPASGLDNDSFRLLLKESGAEPFTVGLGDLRGDCVTTGA